jgi:hypothetical protein
MSNKNDFTYNIGTTSLLSVDYESCSIVDIIILPDKSNYSYQEILMFLSDFNKNNHYEIQQIGNTDLLRENTSMLFSSVIIKLTKV